ncbi:hypothetical protein NA57DRAFT_76746 [Rhizodiscina lignyota]|uniref:Uncharacterized protein n=1 Tax=Rhizodiscina lignyota TaxID=1504668 RepID=A0A9P4M4P6_9PEZI|nr:hypothetical protein NA57DRAFT_76746 [Rhizodiscina lignyota]
MSMIIAGPGGVTVKFFREGSDGDLSYLPNSSPNRLSPPESPTTPVTGNNETRRQDHHFQSAFGTRDQGLSNSTDVSGIVPDEASVQYSFTPNYSPSKAFNRGDSSPIARRHNGNINTSILFSPSVGETPSTVANVSHTPTAADLPIRRGLSEPGLTKREAFLLRSYIDKLAPWSDPCDPARHFATEVPRRALQVPMILYGILALSSRHQASITASDDVEASFYHGRCLELVISALSCPEDSYDDALLAAVVICRLYEEFDIRDDTRCHLLGTSQLLNTMATFSSSGGLAEAASWLSLRQAIYSTLVLQEPWALKLENYERSSVFRLENDAAYANVIILLMAKILSLTYSTDTSTVTKEALERIEIKVDEWNNSKPELFRPIYFQDADLEKGEAIPDIQMLNSAQVIGLQYYHGSKILLILMRASSSRSSGYEAARQSRNAEASLLSPPQIHLTYSTHQSMVRTHLAMIIGLANSNLFVENANFLASHFLKICGYCFSNPVQRQAVIQFLVRTEQAMGWRTTDTIAALKAQWRDLDAL